MPSANRSAQIARWFHKHILGNPDAHKLLMEAVPGDDRWIHAAHKQNVPKYFKDPAKWRLFKHGLCKLALPIWEARDAAHKQKTGAPQEEDDPQPTEETLSGEDDTSTIYRGPE